MPTKPIREGFHTLTPCLFVQGTSRLIEFICAAFSGEVTFRKTRPDGAVMHCEMRIGDSMLMLGDATEGFGPMPTSIYLYVTDCDAVYHSALFTALGPSGFRPPNLGGLQIQPDFLDEQSEHLPLFNIDGGVSHRHGNAR